MTPADLDGNARRTAREPDPVEAFSMAIVSADTSPPPS